MQLLIRIGLKSGKMNDIDLQQLRLQFRKWNLAGQEQSYPNCGEQVLGGWEGQMNWVNLHRDLSPSIPRGKNRNTSIYKFTQLPQALEAV